MFPAEALARALVGRGLRVAMVTDSRGGAFGGADLDVEVYRVRAATVGAGLIGKLKTAWAIAVGYIQARGILKRLKPAALVGFGGYASAPTVLAAGGRRVPVMLHEQNAILGRANRKLLARRASAIAVAFPAVGGADGRRPGQAGAHRQSGPAGHRRACGYALSGAARKRSDPDPGAWRQPGREGAERARTAVRWPGCRRRCARGWW